MLNKVVGAFCSVIFSSTKRRKVGQKVEFLRAAGVDFHTIFSSHEVEEHTQSAIQRVFESEEVIVWKCEEDKTQWLEAAALK